MDMSVSSESCTTSNSTSNNSTSDHRNSDSLELLESPLPEEIATSGQRSDDLGLDLRRLPGGQSSEEEEEQEERGGRSSVVSSDSQQWDKVRQFYNNSQPGKYHII